MKNFPTLRDWIDDLAENDLITIAKPGLSLNFELAALAHRLDGERATFFPTPGGHSIPVVSGIMSTRPWIARAMGVDEKGILKKYQEAVSAPMPCKVIPQSNAKVQEVIHAGPIDLAALLPAPIHNEHDGGAYITAGLLISANPKTGKQNVSINRCQLQGGNKLGVSVSSRDTGAFLAESEKQGKPMPITIVIGVDVMTLLASQALVGQDQDELEVAGALHGQPLEVVKSITNDLMIPAHAEIAIEGFFVPGVRELEGPFGEFTQYYGPQGERFVIEVTTVTHRKSPLFHTIIGGGTEHLMLGAVPREASFLTNMQRVFPNVLNVHLPKGGVGRYHLIVQIKKIYEGSAKNIIFSALSMHHDVKLVIVVDEDIDIYNSFEVDWAIATRFQADKDMVLESNCRASKLDPTSRGGIGSKLGIDATKPLDAKPEQFLKIKVPGAAELNLDSVIQKVNGKKWRENLVS